MQLFANLFRNNISFGIYVLFLLLGTLTPNSQDSKSWFWFLEIPLIEILLNFFLLVPLALFLKGRFNLATSGILLAALVTTTAIEFLQLFIPGRVPDLQDIALNFTGAWLLGISLGRGLFGSTASS